MALFHLQVSQNPWDNLLDGLLVEILQASHEALGGFKHLLPSQSNLTPGYRVEWLNSWTGEAKDQLRQCLEELGSHFSISIAGGVLSNATKWHI